MDVIRVMLTSALSAAALFFLAKVMGHKQMSQLGLFDYITGITIGSIAAELATELERPWKPLFAMLVYGVITVLLTFFTDKLPKMRKWVNGTPTIVLSDGKLYRENMKKAKLDLSEFLVMCRQEGYFDLNDIQTAVFEYNGRLSLLPKATKRPVTPTDMNLVPPPEKICCEVIMDGKILHENLQRMGLDLPWLKHKLRVQGYQTAKEIFLGICDAQKQLTLFEKKNRPFPE